MHKVKWKVEGESEFGHATNVKSRLATGAAVMVIIIFLIGMKPVAHAIICLWKLLQLP